MAQIFISYSTKDAKIASLIREKLKQAGVSTWMDTDLQPGADWEAEVNNALKNAAGMVLVLSASSLNSPEVAYEYRYILKQNKRLYPVLVEPISSIPSQLSSIQGFNFVTDFDAEIQSLIEAIRNPSYLAQSDSENPQVNVRLKIDRDKLASLMATLIEAGAEKIEVENVGKAR